MDSLLCCLAVLGLGISLWGDYHDVRHIEYAASDYKTLYGSTLLYRIGQNPYQASLLPQIYLQNGVVLPKSSFGHMPVYPPVTLLVLLPLTYLPLAASARVWLGISMLAVMAAISLLLAEARAQKLNWVLRLGLIGSSVGAPMLAYAFDLGNVSPVAGALATISLLLAVRISQRTDGLLPAIQLAIAGFSLGIALALKPHLALWIALAVALIAGRAGRWITALGALVLGACGLLSLVPLWLRGNFRLVIAGFLQILRQERSSGSMSPSSREILSTKAQITGLDSLLGLHFSPPLRTWAVAIALTLALSTLVWLGWRNREQKLDRSWQLLFGAAMFSVGMIASYHRAHDAVLLPWLLGVWICAALQKTFWREAYKPIQARLVVGLIMLLSLEVAMWVDFPASFCNRVALLMHRPGIAELLQLRHEALVSAILACCLLMILAGTPAKYKKKRHER